MAKTTIKTLLRAAMGSKSIRYIGPDKPRRLKRSLTNIGTNFKPIMASGSTIAMANTAKTVADFTIIVKAQL